ncbi:hypothetical protein [Amycolatopsis samaneae]|uniref:Translation initiation factor IF-2 n=1 Tax=Amycolatopsis samaneae TaxID=664691 RepID=A0ABW5GLX0_9PSEU
MASDSEGQRSPSDQDEAAAEPARTLRVFPPAGPSDDGDRARLRLVADPAPAEPDPEPEYEKVPLEVLSGTAGAAAAGQAEPVTRRRGRLPSTPTLIALAGAAVVLVSVPFLITELWVAPKSDGDAAVNATDGVPALVNPPVNTVPGQPAPGLTNAPGVPPGGARATGQPAGPSGAPVPGTGKPEAPPAPGPVVAGAGCPNTARASYQKAGEYAQGRAGWNSYPGGAVEAGCTGTFDAMPMAGNANGAPDPQTYTRWLFDVSDVVTAGHCAVSVYIPNDGNIEHVGGVKAHYSVFRSLTTSSDNVVGVADVDQPAHLGQWVSLGGPFKIDAGKLAVKLNNSGVDWNSGDGKANYRHIASTQLKVSCTPG